MDSAPKITAAPGLAWRHRKTGWEARWICRHDLSERGFTPKSQRIWFGTTPNETQTAYIQSRCQALQAEMLVWGRGGLPVVSGFDGTWRGLIDCYRSDKHSPYRKLRYRTRIFYNKLCDRIMSEFGDQLVRDTKPREVREWHDGMAEAGKIPMGHAVIGMIRTIVYFGASILEDDDCALLAGKLKMMRFPMGKPRKESLSAEQAILIRKGAHEVGRPSIALAQAFQFDCMFRQKDVIGEWVPFSEADKSEVLWGNNKWLRGIRWSEIDDTLVLRHVTSKRQKEVEIDLKNAAMVLEELDLIFPGWGRDRNVLPRTGPIIVSDYHGVPWGGVEFSRQWRMIANRMGIPKTVRNMDSRSGAITEALAAGASLDSVRKMATHSDVQMTQRYSRGDAEAAAEVMQLRIASRNKG